MEEKAMSLMPCYAEVRREPVHVSKWLLTSMLRKNGVLKEQSFLIMVELKTLKYYITYQKMLNKPH